MWGRGIAVVSLLGMLFLCAVSAAHFHSTATRGAVGKDCQLCATGVSQTLSVAAPLIAALILIFVLPVLVEVQPCVQHWYRPGNPRSPPVLS